MTRPLDTLCFKEKVDKKISRKLSAQREKPDTVWLSLRHVGLIGWSVVVPTLLGAMLGLWLDKNYPSAHSWTMALLMLGLTLGCANAWRWVAQEQQKMQDLQNAADD